MIGHLKDIPDPVIGVFAAGSLWLGVCYGALTQRVMDADMQNDMLPACMAQLKAEQEAVLETALYNAKQKRVENIDRLERRIKHAAEELYKQESTNAMVGAYGRMLRKDGLDLLFPHINLLTPNNDEVNALKTEIAKAEAAIKSLPQISFPRVPDSEIFTTCSCAAVQTMSGKRMDYAISLASFRLIEPEAVAQTKKDMEALLQADACGKPAWEYYS